MSSSASGVQSNSNNTSGRIGNIFDDPDLVSSIMRMPTFPKQSSGTEPQGPTLLDTLPSDPFISHIQDSQVGTPRHTLHKPESGDQSYILEEETDLGELWDFSVLCVQVVEARNKSSWAMMVYAYTQVPSGNDKHFRRSPRKHREDTGSGRSYVASQVCIDALLFSFLLHCTCTASSLPMTSPKNAAGRE